MSGGELSGGKMSGGEVSRGGSVRFPTFATLSLSGTQPFCNDGWVTIARNRFRAARFRAARYRAYRFPRK